MGSPAGQRKILISSRRKKEQGATALVLVLGKAFGRVSLPVVWAWTTHFKFPRKILRLPCGHFDGRMCGGATPDQHGDSSEVWMELLIASHCAAGCVEGGDASSPALKGAKRKLS